MHIGHIDREHVTQRVFKYVWKPAQRKFSLEIAFDFKTLRIIMGDPTRDEIRHDIAIKFDNFKNIVTGSDFMEHCKKLLL